MRGIHYKGMRGKSNVIKRNVEKVWGARYLPKNTVLCSLKIVVSTFIKETTCINCVRQI
jgi:hypothetical protein